ncbi:MULTISPECIES: hypothetical protein [Olivibacter]|uniref:Uncharacterized protein n=3 Tax=Sphingobacteriaceae TaxID=84566 RepID=F4C7P4_SPHS2|nr:hypothetical protein [Olivibacter sp. LS-1]MDX3914762.1 hypothetical protein [Pseudosphingobacterium sp.]QEL03384.1 hypothetical protein FKG96_21990 [Olivibacter sp. LS-1]
MSKFHTFTSPENLSVMINLKKIAAVSALRDGKSNILLDNGHNIIVEEQVHNIQTELDSDKQ